MPTNASSYLSIVLPVKMLRGNLPSTFLVKNLTTFRHLFKKYIYIFSLSTKLAIVTILLSSLLPNFSNVCQGVYEKLKNPLRSHPFKD